MATEGSELPAEGDVVGGKYRLERLLGRGGMGAVFEATHEVTGRRVAIKWLLPEHTGDDGTVSRFLREARAAGGVEHPNVVAIHDVGEQSDAPFLVMERLRGEPLSALLARGPLEPERAVEILLPAMRGIAAAHERGVVHRDLKPDNIFLCEGPSGEPQEPKVLDFGVSKLLERGDGPLSVTLTQPGTLLGTPHYMAPEQLEGHDDLDARVDVYALGVVLYRALAGRVPFDADKLATLVLHVARGDAVPLAELRPDIDPELAAVVERAMARDPEDRFADVPALARALEPFGGGARFDAAGGGPSAGASRSEGAAALARTYTDDEVEEILRRAIEREQSAGGELEHEDLVAAAQEVGIDRAALDSAIRQMERERRDEGDGQAARPSDAPPRDDAAEPTEIEQRTRRKLTRKRRRFKRHLGTYAIFGVFFFVLDVASGSGWWFHWPLIGWGVAVALQAFRAYVTDFEELREEEERKEDKRRKRRERKAERKGKSREGTPDAPRTPKAGRLDERTIEQSVDELLEAARRGPKARVSVPRSEAQEHAEAERGARDRARRRES